MVIYGIYGLLFLAGVAVLIFISVGRVAESAVKAYGQMGFPQVLLILAGMAALAAIFLSGSVGAVIFVLGFVIFVLVPLAIFLLIKKEITRRTWKKKEEAVETAKFKMILKKDPDNIVGHMGLAKAYEKYDRYAEAAQEYHVAAQKFPGEESGYSERLEQKGKLMRRMLAIEQKRKTNICSQCQEKNRPQRRRCSRCGNFLYRNGFEWAWKNTSMGSKIGAAIVVAVSLLYLIWVPFTYSLTLLLMWLAVIVYFSLPVEAYFSD